MKKKMMAMVMAAMLVCALVACGGEQSSVGGTEAGGNAGASAMESLGENASPARTVIADFTDKVNAGTYGTTEELAASFTEAEYIPFMGAYMPVEAGYLNGFTDEITGFKEGYMFGPAIGSIPFIGYVFVLEDGVKADDFIANLKSLGDLRWNVCTSADEMLVGAVGDKVCFVMAPATFEE